jgi:hypothetical protein
MKKLVALIIFLVVSLICPRSVSAASVSWDGGGNGSCWADPNNWSNNSLPTAADDVTINVGSTINLAPYYDVSVGGSASGTFTTDESALFDNVINVRVASGVAGTQVVIYDLGAGNSQTVNRYSVRCGDNDLYAPRQWVFQGSNDGSSWTTLDTVSSQTGWTNYERRLYSSFSNPGNIAAYRYYRFSAMQSSSTAFQVYLSELEIFTDVADFASLRTINSLVLGNASGTSATVLNFDYDAITDGALIIDDGDITLHPATIVTHTVGRTATGGTINISVSTGSMTINGKINANSKGLFSSEGDGSPTLDGSSNGGGGYGGQGGLGTSLPGGSVYGSLTQPISVGSGGGHYNTSYIGGYGGGAIKLNIGATLSIGGTISSNGGNNPGSSFGPGGGSGGSVYLITSTLIGSGTVMVNGGNGSSDDGGGGGGRIAVYYDNSTANLTYQAFGGTGKGVGGAGTVYVKDNALASGDLTIDNNNQNPLSGSTTDRYFGKTTLNGSYTFDNLTIRNFGILNVGTSDAITYSSLDWSTKGVIADNGGTMAVIAPNSDLTIPSTAILFANTTKTYNSLTINGTLTHSGNRDQSTYGLNLTTTGNLTIGASGSINASSQGLASNQGDGKPSQTGSSNGGGGYGGQGGNGSAYSGGSTHGSLTQPTSLGSGGGQSNTTYLGGYGGGAIRLSVGGNLSVGGSIMADGGPPMSTIASPGGGSGGSVYITTATLSGSNVVSAKGGNSGSSDGGGGGGGRIAVYYDSDNSTVSYQAYGGSGTGYGGAGTVYLKDNAAQNGNLLLDNNDQNPTLNDYYYGKTTLNGSFTFNSITIQNYANLNVGSGDSIVYSSLNWSTKGVITDSGGVMNLVSGTGDLTIPATAVLVANTARTYTNLTVNGMITHSDNYDQETYKINLTVNNNLTIGTSGSINADNKGYISSTGTGSPATDGSINGNGGAGYGGAGGNGGGTNGGSTYGSLMEPVNMGSGGGQYSSSNTGGEGGGIIKLTVGSTLTNNGVISANGQIPPSIYEGGGSGGSVYLVVGILTGSGNITGDGGNAKINFSTYYGGGGGGGRIAIYYDELQTSGAITVNGGVGLNNGQAGTVFYKAKSGTLISSPFDAADSGSVLSQLSWGETLPAGTDVKFQLRTAPDSNGVPGAWSAWLGPSGTDSYYTDPTGAQTINSNHTDGENDQWFQYKMILSSSVGDTAVPTVSEVTLAYVINTSPTVTITNSPAQSSTGVLTVQYTVSDPEESSVTSFLFVDIGVSLNESLTSVDSAAVTLSSASILPSSGTVIIDNEIITYTGKSGNDLTGIGRGASITRAASHSLGTIVWLKADTVTGDAGSVTTSGTKAVSWTPRTDIPGLETSVDLKLLVNDGNSANQIASDTVLGVTLDTKAPVNGDIVIDSRLDRLVLTATDANNIKMKISNDADLSSDSQNDDSGTWIDFATPKTWTLPSSTEVVYISHKDVYGNEIGSTLSTTAPTRPSSLLVQDASNPATESWRLFTSWAVSDDPPEGFAYYQLYRSTDNASFVSRAQVNTRTQNFYLDENLDNNLTYYYKVTVVDDHGNESSYNPVSQISGAASRSGVGLVPDGSGGGDFTAPSITGLTAVEITSTSATITWSTDELADSTVGYSTDTSYQDEKGSVTVVTSHSVVLSGLSPATKYYYRAISYDAVANKATQENSSTYYFTTLSDTSGPAISQVTSSVGESTAGITWATSEAANSIVQYGLTTAYGSATSSSAMVLGHSLQITGLIPATKYYYRVGSTDASGNGTTSPGYNFTTSDPTTSTVVLDTAAPSISNISVSNITASSAKISWNTDEDADGKVEYGESTNYERGIAEGNHEFNKSKSVTVIGLAPETVYHYRITVIDKSGNVNSSSDSTFTTSAASVLGILTEDGSSLGGTNAPTISSDGASVSNISGTSVTISWITNKKATSQVYYRPKNSNDNPISAGDATLFLTDHSVNLSGLSPATAYEYQVKSVDVNGNYIVSSKYEFTTTLPDVSSVKVTSVSESSAIISWATIVPTNSSLEYINSFSGEAKTFSDKSLVTNHQVTLSDLYADTVYAFQILIKDESGNLARSSQYSFTTSDDAAGPSITAVNSRSTIVSGQNKVQTVITWSTNEPSDSLVEYSSGSTTNDYESKTPLNGDFVTNHIVVISNLKPATVYRYRVVSKDRSANASQSPAYVLLTPQKEVSAFDLILQNLEGAFGWAKKITR